MRANGRFLAAALAALASVPGCRAEAPPRAAPPPPKVTVVRPEIRDYAEYEDFNGWTAPVAVVEIRARVRGHIEKVHFRDGDMVKAGDVLFTLDPRPFQAEVDAAVGQVKVFEAQRVAAQKEHARLKELQAKGGASMSQLEKAEADVASLDAQIESQGREIDRLRLDIEYSKVVAPISGKVGKAELTEGNLVNAGGSDPILTTVVTMDPIQVYFSVPEKTLLRVRERREKAAPGEAARRMSERKVPFRFGLETDRGFPREGILDFADNRVDPETGTIQLRGVHDNPSGLVVPGTRARVRVVIDETVKVSVVPDIALMADMDRRYVLVAGEGNKVVRKDVLPGRLLDDGMRILLPAGKEGEGVGPSDRVIVHGQQRARIHYPVEPLDAAGSPVPETAPAGGR